MLQILTKIKKRARLTGVVIAIGLISVSRGLCGDDLFLDALSPNFDMISVEEIDGILQIVTTPPQDDSPTAGVWDEDLTNPADWICVQDAYGEPCSGTLAEDPFFQQRGATALTGTLTARPRADGTPTGGQWIASYLWFTDATGTEWQHIESRTNPQQTDRIRGQLQINLRVWRGERYRAQFWGVSSMPPHRERTGDIVERTAEDVRTAMTISLGNFDVFADPLR